MEATEIKIKQEEVKLTVKLKDLIAFYNVAGVFVSKNKFSKLTYAVDKVKDRIESVISDYNDFLEDIRVDLASSDSEGNILMNEDNSSYRYTKENIKKLNKQVRDKNRSLVTIEPYYVKVQDIPTNLESAWLSTLIPFVIKEEDKFEILKFTLDNKK